jgi:hypothetical protein
MLASLVLLLGPHPCFSPATGEEPLESGPTTQPGAFLYEDGTIHDFDIAISDEAIHGLHLGAPDVHATLTYRGVSWDVGLKLKGSSTYRNLGSKPSFKIDLGQWVHGQKLLGVRRLTLNGMIFDASMMREHVAYHLLEEMGVPAPRQGYARVSVNGEPYGLYSIIESLDEQFLRRQFPSDSDGNLYDTTFNLADLSGFGVGYYELKEGEPLEPYADLHDLVSAIDHGNINDVLEQRFDRDEVLKMWAVDIATPNWDGYTRNTNNYLLYHATLADRWYFIPWGQDTAFRGGGLVYGGMKGRLVLACRADRTCSDALDAAVRAVADTWVSADLAGYGEEAWQLIEEECEVDPRKDMDCKPDNLFEPLADRPGQIYSEVP